MANPNCSTIIALMAVTPIHKAKTVKRMVVSTYQAASGAGQAAMDELEAQTKAVIDGTDIPMEIFPFQYAFNLFSHNAPMEDNGYNEEVRPQPPAAAVHNAVRVHQLSPCICISRLQHSFICF